MKLSDWMARVDQYFVDEGFVPLAEQAAPLLIPDKISERQIQGEEDPEAPLGIGPPSDGSVAEHYDAFAPYYETLVAIYPAWEWERRSFALIASEIESRNPSTVYIAGCGTGLVLGFLVQRFPRVQFVGWDLSGEMIRLAQARLDRLAVPESMARVLQMSHVEAASSLEPADILICKCSIFSGPINVPNFSHAPSPQMAMESWLFEDPTVLKIAEQYLAFSELVAVEGRMLEIGTFCRNGFWIAEDYSGAAGFEPAEPYIVDIEDVEDEQQARVCMLRFTNY